MASFIEAYLQYYRMDFELLCLRCGVNIYELRANDRYIQGKDGKMNGSIAADKAAKPKNNANGVDKLQKSGIIETQNTYDFTIGKSVGAKSHNYEVIDKQTGKIYKFVEGTRITDTKVFAGYRGSKPLYQDTVEGLVREWGGQANKWQHVKGFGILDVDGESIKAEIHWFQEDSVGKVKFKVKEWLYDES